MQIDRVMYPITSLGPGQRLVIWTIGCSKHCKGCSNPELWDRAPSKNIDVDSLASNIIKQLDGQKIDGITITGGDPLEQYDELVKLILMLKPICDDILVYTGYIVSEIPTDKLAVLKKYVDVLIDGRYINERNTNECVLRGSANQNLIFFNEKVKEKYETYLKEGRKIQNVFYENKAISVGIHNIDKTKKEV